MSDMKLKFRLSSVVPRKLISRLVGHLASWEGPDWLIQRALKVFCSIYKVKLSDVEQSLSEFTSLNDFFTRHLKQGVRPIAQDQQAIVAPVDGSLEQWGTIHHETLIQAKGIEYPLSRLVPTEWAEHFRDGTYLTFYLSPSDCHLVFSPIDAEVVGACHVPGKLFPVKASFAHHLPGLFTINERLITYLNTGGQRCAVVMVGASNVGQMTTTFDSTLITNQANSSFLEKAYQENISFTRGQHLASFLLGSTVILLFQKGQIKLAESLKSRPFQYGEQIGHLIGEPS
jgi:phosphatidylserine decarboxylase